MYAPFHKALNRIPVAGRSAVDRQDARFMHFIAGAVYVLSEAATASLPFATKADVHALWRRVKGQLPQTSPEVAVAIHAYLEMVRSEEFGTDVLGLYWGAHGPDGGRDIAQVILEQVFALELVDGLPAGFDEALAIDAGGFGRIALDVMRRIDERHDIDLADVGFIVQGEADHLALAATVAVLASCLVHDRLPGEMAFLTGSGVTICRLGP